MNDLMVVPMTDLGLERNQRATRGLATKDKLLVPHCSTTEHQQHFAARTIAEYRLAQSTTSADIVLSFRSQLYRQP